ncbi:hypothetical protein HHK36_015004 [Tetracentron sinense]|uniref:Uncharacterized protein n=1 Tax=Tetracentron sinense TaxID=13715 RepID=A0A835DGA8_TETSI|nr:hypothetical protein HHK36_015004 [Tetracentron sinense]
MGKKRDALLGRTFKTSKFKTLVNLSISRLAVLKNQRQVRCSHARSDIVQILNLGHHDRALLRVEHVIKDQNMLDVFVMIEGYCHLLIERVDLVENNKECPDELKEAISSLLFAASRCGEFPELQAIREVFISRYGKEFVAGAVGLRNNCGVNLKIIQKLSTRQPSLESKLKVLKEIASENGITMHLEEASSVIIEEKPVPNQKQSQPEPDPSANLDNTKLGEDLHIEHDDQFSGSMKARKYSDVAAAAQAAFKLAANAAEAAKAAVELSQSDSQGKDPGNQSKPTTRRRNISNDDGSLKSRLETAWNAASGEIEHSNAGLSFEQIHPINNLSSESEDEEVEEIHIESHPEEYKQSKNKAELERSLSTKSSDSGPDALKEMEIPSNVVHRTEPVEQKIVFDESDDETGNMQSQIPWLKHWDLTFDKKSGLLTNEFPKTRQSNAVTGEDLLDESGVRLQYPSQKHIPPKTRGDPCNLSHVQMDKLASGSGNSMSYSAEGRSRLESVHHLETEEEVRVQRSKIEKKPVSVRTRRVHRQ